MSGIFLNCSKGVKDLFEVQEGRCDFPRDASAEKGFHLTWRGEPPGFSRVGAGSSGVTTGTTGTRSCGFREGQSPCELQAASQDSSPVGAGS